MNTLADEELVVFYYNKTHVSVRGKKWYMWDPEEEIGKI